MNDIKDKIQFDKNFLIKYSGLFTTYKLDYFYDNLQSINQSITNDHKEVISIFFYISDQDNNIVYAFEQIYNPINEKQKDYFLNHMKSLFEKEYVYTTKKALQELHISYTIIPHNIDANDTNYKKIKLLNKNFVKIYYKLGTNNFIIDLLKPLKNHLPLLFSIISVFILSLVLLRLNTLPMQTVDLNILSISITKIFIQFLLAILILTVCQFLFFTLIKWSLLLIFPKKIYMYYQTLRQFNLVYETINFIIIEVISFLAIFIFISIWTYYYERKVFFIDNVIRDYLISTQVPSIMKIKYNSLKGDDLNSTQTVLYLGNGDTFNYFPNKEVNLIISKNQKLYEKICMSKETGYIDDLMPLLFMSDISNKVHTKAIARDITILPETIGFKEAFCYAVFPKVVQLTIKDKNETILWMGTNEKQDHNISYYYTQSQIKSVLEKNPTLKKDSNNSNVWIQNMMQSKVLQDIKYNSLEDMNLTKIKDINISKEFL